MIEIRKELTELQKSTILQLEKESIEFQKRQQEVLRLILDAHGLPLQPFRIDQQTGELVIQQTP